ncbi:type II CAAX endopeptidase family protein [Oceanicella actignis]|uniref:type II CAAX endopeptidase family protein n=1 Tax=Oceanicella actignis TaxID=1189325 RepID=UPI0011E84C67|nr:type II CAAX endopeptidase family protein [Oceanicella actignis]
MSSQTPPSPPPRPFVHPLRAFSAPAQARAELWRTALGAALAAGLAIGFGALARRGFFTAMAEGGPLATLIPPGAADMLGTLVGFLGVWPALWLVVRVLHRRPGATLFGPDGRVNWRHFRIGLGISLGVGALAWLPILHRHGPETFALAPLGVWAPLALAAAPMIFIQAAAEELFFRGYLLQQIAARTWSILGWSVLPSALFAMAHPAAAGPLGISWYHFVFGLVMAAVTSRTANLGGAIGLHLGTNLVNLLIVSPERHLSGLALFVYPPGMDARAAIYTYIAVMFLGATVFMARMDLRFLREWKAHKRATQSAGRPAEPLPMKIYAPGEATRRPAPPERP